jgi:hypothetical protein
LQESVDALIEKELSGDLATVIEGKLKAQQGPAQQRPEEKR